MRIPRRWLRLVVSGAACLSVAACGGGDTSGSAEPIATSELARMADAVDQLGPSYTYDLTSTCGERSIIGSFRITVRHGRAVIARPLGASRLSGLRAEYFPTLAALVEEARDTRPAGILRLTTGDTGLPVLISLDPNADAIDDEACYRVARIRNAQDENSR